EQMLRITPIANNGIRVTLKLEGKLLTDWAPLLEQECEALLAQRKRVRLDCSAVTYLDECGVETVRKLRAQGITLLHSSVFIDELLDRGGQS
ncbi:MAG: STAS domain-containing protein, partial [Nitrospiraceae bacterium]